MSSKVQRTDSPAFPWYHWAVVTITTVDYGDLVPQTAAGRFVAGFGMLVGYSIIAVPTAIIRGFGARQRQRAATYTALELPSLRKRGHALAAMFCQHCGAELDVPSDIRERAQRDADQPTPLFGYRKYWAECLGPAPWLPMSRPEMEQLGWDSRDIIIVSGDGYVDHPSFGMAVIGRVPEAQGFRVGMLAQPDWQS